MAPRLARSLVQLLGQLDDAFPIRLKASDGWIADDRHRAEAAKQPDKPPWEVTQHVPNGRAVVCALDITHDPAHGVDCHQLLEQLDASNDPRIFYLIFDHQIDNSDDTRTPYEGANGHEKHLHISTWPDHPDLYDNPSPWALPMLGKDSSPMAITLSQEDLDAIADRVAEKLYAPTTGRGKWNLQAIYRAASSADHRVDVIDDTVVQAAKDSAAGVDLLHQVLDVLAQLPGHIAIAAPTSPVAALDDHISSAQPFTPQI